ncbi:MAG: tRNA epoxyqueuosine(34) reductase QueG [Akkermansia sp.]|nr:tRNA epoxyqueuosine(34) reductase QueG [Akkermansia sp.]
MSAALQALERAAAALGFSAVGVAPADADQGEHLRQWLAEGMHAGMLWMERHLPARLNPQLVLPGARSVVILTYEYARRDARPQPGAVARYAQGEDYHKLLAGKLADLDETLQMYGGEQRCFTDSGPVSERFFAWRAGLGWIGRNGLLIRPGRGSYCFLASILTTLQLPCGTPMNSHCGNCRRCEDACPTRALHNGCCDAGKCLSYWTIEAHEPMPPAIAAALGNRLYGCDACQEACPWNAAAKPARIDPHLLMPAQLRDMPLAEIENLTEDAFAELFTGTPIRRIGRAHLAANARTISKS